MSTIQTEKAGNSVKEYLRINNTDADAFFFHKPEEQNGYLSNWYPSAFSADGMMFSSAEQYIMYQKCMIFGDTASAEKILTTDDVQLQQSIGRKASGYEDTVWNGMRQLIAVQALLAKFSQNPDLLEKLLQTDSAYLVECAASDKIWACGVRLTDTARYHIAAWHGQNLLGFALMNVREQLRKK